MIIGHVHVDEERRSVDTHRDSYRLDTLTVVFVRRPFLAGGLLFGGGLAGFAAAFGDLLYLHETALTLTVAGLGLAFGWQAGQLKLLSRDLRGSDLADVIWGRYADLNLVRMRIAHAMARDGKAGRS
jgi:hypothetical protein